MNTLHKIQSALMHDIYHNEQTSAPYLDIERFGSLNRLNIYTNNLRLGLHDGLSNIFPVIKRLVGDDYFYALATRYLESHPLHQGNRNQFGHQLPDFIKQQRELDELPYISEVAHIEWCYFQASIAADCPAMDFDQLGAALSDPAFVLTPQDSVYRINTQFNSLEIWQTHQHDAVDEIVLCEQPYTWLLWRSPTNELLFKSANSALVELIQHSQQRTPFAAAMADLEPKIGDMKAFQQTFAELIGLGFFKHHQG